MFEFLITIFNKATSVIVSVMITTGLVSAPIQPQVEVKIDQEAHIQEQVVIDKSKSQIDIQPSGPDIIEASPARETSTSGYVPISDDASAPKFLEAILPPIIRALAPTSNPGQLILPPTQSTPASQAKIESIPENSKSIVATGWNQKQILVFVYGDNGEKLTDAQIKVTTPDEIQNKTLDGVRPYNQAYTLDYYPKFAGTHTISFSVPSLDITKDISFEATPYTQILPEFKFDPAFDYITSTSQNNLPKEITRIRISSPDANDEYYIRDVAYKIISDTLTDTDISLSFMSLGNEKLDPANPFSSAIPKESSKYIGVRMDSASKTGKFKLSISAKVFSVNDFGKEFVIENLPLMTPEIEIK